VLESLKPKVQAVRSAAYAAMSELRTAPEFGQCLLQAERLVWDLGQKPAEERSSGETLASIAQAHLKKAHGRVQRSGQTLARLDALQRHALRIQVKRLRYELDMWQGLWPLEQTQDYTNILKSLQTVLGELNDFGVAVATLRSLHVQSNRVPIAEANAMLMLDALEARESHLLQKELPDVARLLTELDLIKSPWNPR